MRGFEDEPIDWAPMEANGEYITLRFITPGRPVQKGRMIQGRWGGIHDATKGLAEWEAAVSHQAEAAMRGAWRKRQAARSDGHAARSDATSGSLDRLHGAVCIDARFVMPRPKTTTLAGIKWNLAKAFTPPFIKAPDGDKLFRSVGDAMTGIVYDDDAQIVDLRARKRFADLGETPGAIITVTTDIEVW